MQALVAVVLMIASIPAFALAPAEPPAPMRQATFSSLGTRAALQLRGPGASTTIEFGTRSDELVRKAAVRVTYAYSPELAASGSQLRLALNGEAAGVLPVEPAEAGRLVTHEIALDPRLLVGFNRLVIDLASPPAIARDEAQRARLWAEVSGASEIELGVQALALADDLARLPEPFFDRHDARRVVVPFVFASRPSRSTLRAAAEVASWIGQLSAWRGTRFPVGLGEEMSGHAIAFATNGERPAFLANLPQVTGPRIRIMTNPADGRSKLLLLLGRDGNDLKAAADALVLGGAAVGGPELQVKPAAPRAARAAFDAPGWVHVDRPAKFAELIEWPQQLEATGSPPALDAVRVNLRIPPDLAAWRTPGVPVRLKFRYTAPPCTREASLEVGINDEPLQSLALRTGEAQGVSEEAELVIPAFRLRSRIQLQFRFRFAADEQPRCRAAAAPPRRAAIDPESTIDFSGFPHYIELPNLGHFAAVGFPFTKFADLSQTVLVLPESPAPGDIEAMLAILARMGEATGVAATGVRVAAADDEAQLRDADILVVGTSAQQGLLDRWSTQLPLALATSSRSQAEASRRPASPFAWVSWNRRAEPTRLDLEADGPLALLLGFESPLSPGRSVVAATASMPAQLGRILDVLDDPEARRSVGGSVALIHPTTVESLRMGPTYATGYLPPWAGMGYEIAAHPGWSAAAAAIAAWLAWIAAAGMHRAWVARRERRRP